MNLLALPIWITLFILRLVMILIGLVVVPIAVPFRSVGDNGRTPTVGQWQDWKFVGLPKWAWFWCSERDGCMGDIRGNYDSYQRPEFTKNSPYLKAVWWLAIRNPTNNFSRRTPVIAIDMKHGVAETVYGQDEVKDSPGMEGFQFIKATGRWNVPYWGFYWVSKFKIKNHSVIIRLGHKMDIFDNDFDWSTDPTKSWKGMTFRIGFEDMTP